MKGLTIFQAAEVTKLQLTTLFLSFKKIVQEDISLMMNLIYHKDKNLFADSKSQ